MDEASGRDRRQHPRMAIEGSAVVIRGDEPLGRFSVRNVSRTGILLHGTQRVGAGESVHILLALKGGKKLGLTGEVLRTTRTKMGMIEMVVHFNELSNMAWKVLQRAETIPPPRP